MAYPDLYGNYNSYGMQGYQNNPLGNVTFQSPLQKTEVIRVHGKDGASAFALAPNSSVLLLDETAPVVWCKMTDGAGFPTLKGYTISELKEPEPEAKETDTPVYVTTKEFDSMKSSVEEKLGTLSDQMSKLMKELGGES